MSFEYNNSGVAAEINISNDNRNASPEQGSAGGKDLITEELDYNPMICEIDSGLLLVHGRMDETRQAPLQHTQVQLRGELLEVGPSHSSRGKTSSGFSGST